MGAAINVGEVYVHLLRDLHGGTYSTPGFEHALHNARLVEVVNTHFTTLVSSRL
jgi:hypothetical protein